MFIGLWCRHCARVHPGHPMKSEQRRTLQQTLVPLHQWRRVHGTATWSTVVAIMKFSRRCNVEVIIRQLYMLLPLGDSGSHLAFQEALTLSRPNKRCSIACSVSSPCHVRRQQTKWSFYHSCAHFVLRGIYTVWRRLKLLNIFESNV